MNRKNLTCAVLAGLAGVAGLAGTAQAVNLNPDGLGQVLIYPYYTANAGNQTILSVVNTTDNGKAVKVRFLEGFNSREVLDFNLYLSHHDVWVASIADDDGTPTLFIPDSSCTVPYLYDEETGLGMQKFLPYAFTGDFEDGGPTDIGRASEGYFEMIEMGTLGGDADAAATHEDGVPTDCQLLTDNWTKDGTDEDDGIWYAEATAAEPCEADEKADQACTDTTRASGGLFGGAAVVNANNGTMYSYDAKAIQGFDKTPSGLHFQPGTVRPSLAGGSETNAWVFFGVPQNRAVELFYRYSVDAVSAVFMHEYIMNEYTTEDDLAAGTEWVITFPTKSYYADALLMETLEIEDTVQECTGEGEDEVCVDVTVARPPFTQLFGATDDFGDVCELVGLTTWDREERTFAEEIPGSPPTGPIVSPPPPPGETCDPAEDVDCHETPFQLCHEVNVLQFGDSDIFGTPSFDGDSLLLSVEDEFTNGWGRINLGVGHVDKQGLVGLPVTGFAAYEFENDFVDGDGIKAYYGGLFGHKGNLRRIAVEVD